MIKKLIAITAMILSIATQVTIATERTCDELLALEEVEQTTKRNCKTCRFLIAIDRFVCSNHSNRSTAADFHAHMQNVMAKNNCTQSPDELQAATDYAQEQEVQHRGSSSQNIIHSSDAWGNTALKLKEELVKKHCPKPRPGE